MADVIDPEKFEELSKEAAEALKVREARQSDLDVARKALEAASQDFNMKRAALYGYVQASSGVRQIG